MTLAQENKNDWVSLDDWKPMIRKKIVVPLSNWRRNSINPERSGFEIGMPDRDDFKKINFYIKNGANKYEIIRAFKINHHIFNKIKDGLYCPERGILKIKQKIIKKKKFIIKKV